MLSRCFIESTELQGCCSIAADICEPSVRLAYLLHYAADRIGHPKIERVPRVVIYCAKSRTLKAPALDGENFTGQQRHGRKKSTHKWTLRSASQCGLDQGQCWAYNSASLGLRIFCTTLSLFFSIHFLPQSIILFYHSTCRLTVTRPLMELSSRGRCLSLNLLLMKSSSQ